MTLTNTQREVFTKVFSYLPHPCASVWIAGGAVVDYDTAADIDVFFGRNNEEAAYAFLSKLSYHKESNTPYGGKGGRFLGEAYIPNIRKTIQVISTTAETADKGLLGFDISTCRWAVLSKGLLEVRGKDATASDQPPTILKASDKTLGRYIKYCNRFGHPIDVEQVKKCVGAPIKVKPLKKTKIKFMADAEDKPEPYVQAFGGEAGAVASWATIPLKPYYSGLVDALGVSKPNPQAQADWNAQMLPAHYQEQDLATSLKELELAIELKRMELEQPIWKVTPTSLQYAKEAKTIEKLLPALTLDKESK